MATKTLTRTFRRLITPSPAIRRLSISSTFHLPFSRSFSSAASDLINAAEFSKVAVKREEEEVGELLYTASAAAPTFSPTTQSRQAVSSLGLPLILRPGVVIYDGECHLCHRGVKWVIQADKDKKIKFCCLQSEAANPYLIDCGVSREDVRRRFLFIEGLGLHHRGSTAALKVASYLPLPYSALSAFLIIPAPLRDIIYDYIAANRYDWFGKADYCLVLKEAELLERFIDREELIEKIRKESV